MRGRKPGSPKVQDLAAGKFKLVGGTETGDAPPPPPPIDPDAPPSWVKSEDARRLWSQLLPDLKLRKQYIRLFEAELGRYCVAFGQYVHALKKMGTKPVVKSSKGVDMLSQWWVVANRAHETMLKLAADLGLNPVAQLRLAGIQLDLFDKPLAATGTDGPAPGNPFGALRRT